MQTTSMKFIPLYATRYQQALNLVHAKFQQAFHLIYALLLDSNSSHST